MEEDEINYRTLRKIQQLEKNSSVLTEIKPDFYNKLSEYLKELKDRLDNETSSQKQMLIKEEIQNTKKIAVNIYEHREKKILLAAISKARGGNPDLKNMVEDEMEIFEPVLNTMLDSRRKILENETAKKNSTEIKTNKQEEKTEGIVTENHNSIVRVTENIPEFIGTDEKKYNLRKNDIISLPDDMSEMLSKRSVVKKINSG